MKLNTHIEYTGNINKTRPRRQYRIILVMNAGRFRKNLTNKEWCYF